MDSLEHETYKFCQVQQLGIAASWLDTSRTRTRKEQCWGHKRKTDEPDQKGRKGLSAEVRKAQGHDAQGCSMVGVDYVLYFCKMRWPSKRDPA